MSAKRSLRRSAFYYFGLCALSGPLLMSGCDDKVEPEAALQESTVFIQVEGALREPGSSAITQKWSGSGVIVSQDGYIVTNNHVAGGSAIRSVLLHGETAPRPATLLGISECSDLAVLKIEAQGLASLNWHEGPIEPGLEVMSAGFPSITGTGTYTLTKGAISTKPFPLSTGWASVKQAIYHTAQINSGNSGGPLVSQSDAAIVGINYAGKSSENSHVAISAGEARQIVEQLKAGKDINSIGISGDVRFVERNGLPVPVGVWVKAVRPGGKADKLGVRPGDVITKIGGINLQVPTEKKNHSMENYCSVLYSNDPNSQVIPIEIARLDANVVCEGQINGATLKTQAVNGQATDCPIGGAKPGGAANPGDKNKGEANPGGGNPGGGGKEPEIPQIDEIEPNQNAQEAQTLTAPVIVRGVAKQGDPALGTPQDPNVGEDLYLFNITQPTNIVIAVQGSNGSDFDLYLLDSKSNVLARQTTRGAAREVIRHSLKEPGLYGIVVDAWSTVTTDTTYGVGLVFE